LYSFRIIPDRGSWLEVQFDTSDLMYIYLDRKRRRRKFLVPTLLRALAVNGGTDEEVLAVYYTFEKLSLRGKGKIREEKIENRVLKDDIVDADSETLIARKYEQLNDDLIEQIRAAGYKNIDLVNVSWDKGMYLKSVQKDPSMSQDDALKDIYSKLRPGDPPSVNNAKQMLKRIFFDPRRYDLGRVGRYKMQQKLGLDKKGTSRVLETEDLIEAVRYLLNLRMDEGTIDDIDHLGSRRIRTVGELLEGQCRVGLARTERLARERMTILMQPSKS
jgi:DNA-directed RNA polymerase subunit beta